MTHSVNRFVQPTAGDLMREAKLLIPLGMSVGAAAELLEAAGGGAAPVVDSRGRCVGVFTAADYRRWLDRARSGAEPAPERGPLAGRSPGDEVRYHVSGRFAAVTPDAGVPELLHQLDGAADPFLIVLDRQARPRGIVCALDVLVADADVPAREQDSPGSFNGSSRDRASRAALPARPAPLRTAQAR